jgi:hypothetical protein
MVMNDSSFALIVIACSSLSFRLAPVLATACSMYKYNTGQEFPAQTHLIQQDGPEECLYGGDLERCAVAFRVAGAGTIAGLRQ